MTIGGIQGCQKQAKDTKGTPEQVLPVDTTEHGLRFLLYKFVYFLLKAQFFSFFFLFVICAWAQTEPDTTQQNQPPFGIAADSLKQPMRTRSDIQDVIRFSAKDSAVFEIRQRRGALYGQAKVNYVKSELEAAIIRMDLEHNLLSARPGQDSLGKYYGRPLFIEDKDKFVSDSMDYNLQSQRGIIYNIVSEQAEGFVGGSRVKRSPENEFYIAGGYYTTCNLAHPHYRVRASKIKLTRNQNVVCGPFHMELSDIPTPLGFAFGIFPKPRQKKSGILVPIYGESRENGFFLRNGGYYWAISDYVDLRMVGEIYTYGNWGVQAMSTFKKRYAYTGSLSVSYNVRYDELPDVVERSESRLFWVNGSFTPETRGDGRFAASLNFGSSQFNRRVSFDLQNQLTNTFQSNVSYSRRFRGTPFSLTVSGRHSQENNTGVVQLNLPTFNFGMTPIYPFKRPGSSKGLLSQLNLAYTLTGSFDITNRVVSPTFPFRVANAGERIDSVYAFSPDNFALFLRNARTNLQHNIPVVLPVRLFKYLSGSLSANFSQRFHREQYRYTWLPDQQAVQVDTLRQLGSSYNYSFSTGLSTNIYGTFYFRKGRYQAIRHLVQPQLSMSFAPDFSGERFGFYQRTQVGVGSLGDPVFRDLPTFAGVSAPGASASLSFSVRNSLEAKLRPASDTTANKKAEKIRLLDELSVSGNYNFLADTSKGQFPLSDLFFRARTRIGGLFDLNLGAIHSPYAFRDTVIAGQQRSLKTFDYAWRQGQGIGRLLNFDFSVSAALDPHTLQGKKRTTPQRTTPSGSLNDPFNTSFTSPLTAPETSYEAYYQASPDQYVDFDIAWSLRLNYKLTYSRLNFIRPVTQSLSFSGDMSLTPKWRIGFSSGFDFTDFALSTTSIDFYRDLHCWEMLFNWRPFGQFQSYSFTIRVKASTLRDLRFERKRTWYDNL